MATTATREPYAGEKKNQLRNGFGVYRYENSFFQYEGEWKNGKKHGHGKLVMKDGSFYEGEFQNGEIVGNGYKYYSPAGHNYTGQFLAGELNGQGVMNYANGSVYEGEWYRNKRQGYGILREVDDSVYQGYLHDHKRHGEGSQTYSNGDRYDGDWVYDKRQGHGEFKMVDGTIYDGQWRNDMFNGQGTMVHVSGMTYEGLWINNKPANLAMRLVFKDVTSPLQVTQTSTFSLEVVTVNEEGEIVQDQGREIKLFAGYKYTAPVKEEKSPSKESSTTGLFEVIEDVEEQALKTPFGYSIVSYPLTDQMPEELPLQGVPHSKTDLSERVLPEEDVLSDGKSEVSAPREEEEAKSADILKVKQEGSQIEQDQQQTTIVTESTSSDLPAHQPLEGTALPPPISNQHTAKGSVMYESLVLPAPPPMYRPFLLHELDEARRDKNKPSTGTKSKPGSRQGKKESDEDSRPGTKAKKQDPGDERFAPTGEYVIVAQDVTDPSFLGVTLEPAFLQINVFIPKKPKRKSSVLVKNQGPRWDTSKHITAAVARSMLTMSQQDMEIAASLQ